MQSIFMVAYVLSGLIQLAAIFAGLADWMDLHWIVAWPIAITTAYIPIVGSVLGILGAVQAWDWPLWLAGLLFIWPIVFFVLVMVETKGR